MPTAHTDTTFPSAGPPLTFPPSIGMRDGSPGWFQSGLRNLAIALSVLALTYIGVLDFQSWSQVDDLWAFRFTPEAVSQHPHYFRYLVMYPGFLLTEWGGEKMLPLYISLFMIGGLILVRRMTEDLGFRACITALIFYAAAHFFMNGRGVISWAAWVLSIYTIRRGDRHGWKVRDTLSSGLAMLGGSVSTGCFAIVYGSFAIIAARNMVWKKSLLGFFIPLVPLIYFSSFFFVGFEKNLAFFRSDGSWAIINMLDHGWGRLLQQSWAYAAAAVTLGILSPFVIHYMLKRHSAVDTLILVAPIAGGAFGFTTLTLFIPSIIIVYGRQIAMAIHRRS